MILITDGLLEVKTDSSAWPRKNEIPAVFDSILYRIGNRLLRSSSPAIVFLLLMVTTAAIAQPAAFLAGKVRDLQGRPVAHVSIRSLQNNLLTTSDANGNFSLPAGTRVIEVAAEHFVAVKVAIVPGRPIDVVLDQPMETVVVTAYHASLLSSDSPASTRVLDTRQLNEAAALELDGKLSQIPGFQLFRRSSSLVANPTTEGVSLRGLGSTAASRSLVDFDEVPLNDPYGGWIHWEELPELSIRSVETVRGGASDLYGSSAIGGVISILPVRPDKNTLRLSLSGGSQSMTDDSLLASARVGKWSGMVAGGAVATDGYTLVAPRLRGPVDQPSNVHAQNALVDVERQISGGPRVFLRASGLNEIRHNGTLVQYNSTRLWRGIGGADWDHLDLRLYGSNEHFRQTFSSIAASRASETLTRFGLDPADEMGAQVRWRQGLNPRALLIAGADIRDIRAADLEALFSGTGGILNTSAHQRQSGAFGEVLFTPRNWTVSAGGRVDHFSNFDPRQFGATASTTPLPSLSETVFDPRLGIVRRLQPWLAWSASAFRAYRAPTENELYRTGQVGQQTTKPNPSLRSERATGWETGFQSDLRRFGSSLRVSYFWNEVNRPITALTLSVKPTQVTLQRENLGQIQSRGISLDYAAQPARWILLTGGWQYSNATVTKFAQQPKLVGKWIPQVAHNMATVQVRMTEPRIGTLSIQERISGRQFDDDANSNLLHGFSNLDASANRSFGQRLTFFASGENLMNRAIEVGRTPILTLGNPRILRFGVRFDFGD